MPTLSDYRQLLATGNVAPEVLTALAADPHKGAQQLLRQYQRRQDRQEAARANFEERLQFERSLWPQYPRIAGIDEVGRGPLAGPVVTAAVIIDDRFNVPVNDSKQLTAHRRSELYAQILTQAVAVSLGVEDAPTIDRENIYHATELGMAAAVNGLRVRPDYLLVDAMTVPVNIPQTKLIKGDARSISIGAASIVAKVARDCLMMTYDRVYPGYDLADNMGYGTAKHLAGLRKLGVTPIHRRSFSPVRAALRGMC
ncbi:ribonuclease HII [Lacticaseibacillus thailandensis]|uniref:Ribonuclease HII n=1 Tax=Lacticaseibacillus thailandensis DSM 22698 = JCM 13996 TaxID=1423810 RepID=A0A0R2C912_9LACO|nr:ribonuclease HII [Lacticaseibacillus thailandensis]KRM88071.1 Ribonuclease HII [Lacticaseibacillus thailandensis DSM 22698 = JCM 13996]